MATHLKVVVIGDPFVGKTALLDRYCNRKFAGSYSLTVGADFVKK